MSPPDPGADPGADSPTRARLLAEVEDLLDTPMGWLGLLWLGVLLLELVEGASPGLRAVAVAIWAAYLLDFAVRFCLATERARWLRREWLTLLSIAFPPFRIARLVPVFHALRVVQGVGLLRVVAAATRSGQTLRRELARRRAGYAAALTVLVTLVGGAGMYVFERHEPGSTLTDYGDALWWTAMLVTTIGSDYWPKTPEGRGLCLALGIFGYGMFGYLAGSIASFFLGSGEERAP